MPKIEVQSHPELTIVGLGYRGKNQAGEIPQLWGQLMVRADEVKNRDFAVHAAYGVSIMEPDYQETMVFDYIAGFPVLDAADELPEGLFQFTIPEGQYAVITCLNLKSINQAYESIFRWVMDSQNYALDLSRGDIYFELYGEEFMPDQGSEKFYIYMPIKEK